MRGPESIQSFLFCPGVSAPLPPKVKKPFFLCSKRIPFPAG